MYLPFSFKYDVNELGHLKEAAKKIQTKISGKLSWLCMTEKSRVVMTGRRGGRGDVRNFLQSSLQVRFYQNTFPKETVAWDFLTLVFFLNLVPNCSINILKIRKLSEYDMKSLKKNSFITIYFKAFFFQAWVRVLAWY